MWQSSLMEMGGGRSSGGENEPMGIRSANVKNIVRAAGHMGIRCLTIYAFSTENWKRPAFEVNFLMHLFKNYLIGQLRELVADNVQVHIIGDTMELPSSLQEEIKVCEKDTANNDGLILNVAINYGGRMELVNAVRDISQKVAEGRMEADSVTEEPLSFGIIGCGSAYTYGR